ncbi:MAG: ABC transporter ATP-binding protein [Rhizobiaceae bacterium]|nr:ABC transporter ATP-binding protein [Rhizobiaceae bacterium]
MAHAIFIRDLHLFLGDKASRVHVLKGMDLEIAPATSTGIVGPSGSGKSTLLMVIAGLERADSGRVEINGVDITGMTEDALAAFRGRNVGIVFQSFHLIPNMTAQENVAVPLELSGKSDAMDIAAKELEAVGLAQRLNHYPAQLSGGEQQRVALARALAPSPSVLIADEPTGNLDGETGRQIADLLFERQRDKGTTLVLVTHDPKLAERCDRMVPVRSGIIEA